MVLVEAVVVEEGVEVLVEVVTIGVMKKLMKWETATTNVAVDQCMVIIDIVNETRVYCVIVI